MLEQSNAKIYLSKERLLNETGIMRSFKTFNAGNYFNVHKAVFGNLYLLNDDTLGPGCISNFRSMRDIPVGETPTGSGIRAVYIPI